MPLRPDPTTPPLAKSAGVREVKPTEVRTFYVPDRNFADAAHVPPGFMRTVVVVHTDDSVKFLCSCRDSVLGACYHREQVSRELEEEQGARVEAETAARLRAECPSPSAYWVMLDAHDWHWPTRTNHGEWDRGRWERRELDRWAMADPAFMEMFAEWLAWSRSGGARPARPVDAAVERRAAA